VGRLDVGVTRLVVAERLDKDVDVRAIEVP
jgi:hypothetical protein